MCAIGAFRIKEINPQASYVLEKNPEYIDADSVKLDGVENVFIESQEAALLPPTTRVRWMCSTTW